MPATSHLSCVKGSTPQFLAERLPRIDHDPGGQYSFGFVEANNDGVLDLLVLQQCSQSFRVPFVNLSTSFELDRSVELSDDQIYLESRTGAPVGEGQKPLTLRLIGSNLFDQEMFEGASKFIAACLNPPHP